MFGAFYPPDVTSLESIGRVNRRKKIVYKIQVYQILLAFQVFVYNHLVYFEQKTVHGIHLLNHKTWTNSSKIKTTIGYDGL